MRAASAARSSCDLRTPAVIRRRAGVEPRPYEGVGGAWWGWRWTKGRVVGDADPYGLRRGRAACRGIFRVRVTTREMVKTPPVAAF